VGLPVVACNPDSLTSQEILHLPKPSPTTSILSAPSVPTPPYLNNRFKRKFSPANINSETNTLDKRGELFNNLDPMNRYGSNNRNCGNTIDSYKNEFNHCNISIPDEKHQILEWISPFASRERHQAIRDSRVGKVGD